MGDEVEVKVYVVPGAQAPEQATAGAAGWDLKARLMGLALVIAPGDRQLVHTGVRLALPLGYEGQVRSRSGLAKEHGIVVLNAPGTVDSDYRGEVCVVLHNTSRTAYTVKPGERIAQLVIAPVPRVRIVAVGSVEDLEATARGAGGFGSTGMGAVAPGGEVPLSAPASDSAEGQLGLFAAMDRGPMEV